MSDQRRAARSWDGQYGVRMRACAEHRRRHREKYLTSENADRAWDPFCPKCNKLPDPDVDLSVFDIRFLKARDGKRFVVGDGQQSLEVA